MSIYYKFEWTDELAREFARAYSLGAYGDYRGCVSIDQKLDKFKELVTRRFTIGDIPKVCSVCEQEFQGFGNNASPLNDGICCDSCNTEVIMARLNQISNNK